MEDKKAKISVSFEGFDPLGLKSIGEISKEATTFGIESAKAFLKLTCRPLLEELGLAGKDVIRNWRLNNIVSMLNKAEGKLRFDIETERLIIDPRVAFQIVDHSSLISDDTLQEMWAGLFAASCQSYEEDENIFFIEILKRLTSSQVKLLNYLCTTLQKRINHTALPLVKQNGTVSFSYANNTHEDIMTIMGTKSKLKADSELNALESMGLLEFNGNKSNFSVADALIHMRISIRPSLIAIMLYVKCQGWRASPFEYFLSDIKSYYYREYGKALQATENDILETIYKLSNQGESFKEIIEYNSTQLIIKSEEWLQLDPAVITERLKQFIVFRYLLGINNTYPVQINGQDIGSFNYNQGYIKS